MQTDRAVLEYWNRDEVESMYDKHLLNLEIELIRQRLARSAGSPMKILDAGCGEGEGTLVYAGIPGARIHAADFSETRLRKAADRLKHCANVTFTQVDFLQGFAFDRDYDCIVSQRFLINLMEWDLQQRVLRDLVSLLRPGGRLLMLEGSQNGVDALNRFRSHFQLEPLPVKWHNLFFVDERLQAFMAEQGMTLIETTGPGAYFLLTRGVRPALDATLNWDAPFNEGAASLAVAETLGFGAEFSRLKLWVFARNAA
jgi:ubiquinone/menaquinone biosynthesis C-methylase UbiE